MNPLGAFHGASNPDFSWDMRLLTGYKNEVDKFNAEKRGTNQTPYTTNNNNTFSNSGKNILFDNSGKSEEYQTNNEIKKQQIEKK